MKFDSTEQWKSKIKRVLISQEEISAEMKKAGQLINSIYDGSPILLVSILKGSFVFMADLCRQVDVPCEIAFMAAKSYFEGTQSSGHVEITMDLKHDISGYHVVIIE
ncbi:phosphoribosyltransferase, partial [Ruminococcus flavefaciens]